MIELQHITKKYADNATTVLDNVSLTIPTGSIYGIIGPSGAGKSTLLRCINLLENPTSGKIKVDDQEITALSADELRQQRQQMGMVFQHFNLLHARTVAQNIDVPLQLARLPSNKRKARVQELLSWVGLKERQDAYPSQLSGGQQQRVGIARALATQPRYLLCDEATSALDMDTTKGILALLEKINKQMGITIVLITHQIEVIKQICDHVALIRQGRVVESGSLRSLIQTSDSIVRQQLHEEHIAQQQFFSRLGLEQGE